LTEMDAGLQASRCRGCSTFRNECHGASPETPKPQSALNRGRRAEHPGANHPPKPRPRLQRVPRVPAQQVAREEERRGHGDAQ
jgi:hypothetical protein